MAMNNERRATGSGFKLNPGSKEKHSEGTFRMDSPMKQLGFAAPMGPGASPMRKNGPGDKKKKKFDPVKAKAEVDAMKADMKKKSRAKYGGRFGDNNPHNKPGPRRKAIGKPKAPKSGETTEQRRARLKREFNAKYGKKEPKYGEKGYNPHNRKGPRRAVIKGTKGMTGTQAVKRAVKAGNVKGKVFRTSAQGKQGKWVKA